MTNWDDTNPLRSQTAAVRADGKCEDPALVSTQDPNMLVFGPIVVAAADEVDQQANKEDPGEHGPVHARISEIDPVLSLKDSTGQRSCCRIVR